VCIQLGKLNALTPAPRAGPRCLGWPDDHGSNFLSGRSWPQVTTTRNGCERIKERRGVVTLNGETHACPRSELNCDGRVDFIDINPFGLALYADAFGRRCGRQGQAPRFPGTGAYDDCKAER